jgi:Domain of unknown function (DUF4394)
MSQILTRYGRVSLRWVIVASLLLGLILTTFSTASASSEAAKARLYLLTTDNQLLSVEQDNPGRIRTRLNITGLGSGERLVGIDVRPATRRLYGIGSTSQVYTIQLDTGVATKIGVPFTPALDGDEFGVDFNPQADRIRVVSDKGQNLRIDPNTGLAAKDSDLKFDPSDVNKDKTPTAVGAAYTNNFAGTTSTALFDIDSNLDILVRQDPPNAGTLKTIGALKVNTGKLVGFDIFSERYGSQVTDTALAMLQVGNASRLYFIDLASGKAQNTGVSFRESIRDIAIFSNNIPAFNAAFALNSAATGLLVFNTNAPEQAMKTIPVLGLASGEKLVGIDARPLTGRLYAIGSTSQVYVIDTQSGFAAKIGVPFTPALDGDEFGVDFNPQADRIRVVSDKGQNLRINPDTGVAAKDSDLKFDVNDANKDKTAMVVGAAYTNNLNRFV